MAYINGNEILFSPNMIIRSNYGALVSGSISTITADDLAGVTVIRDYAFSRCTSLKSVVIPDHVERLGESVFYDSPTLESVDVAESVTSIGSYCFRNCNAKIRMRSATPPTLEKAGTIIFSGFTGTIIVPKGCGDVYKNATNWSAVASKIVEEAE